MQSTIQEAKNINDSYKNAAPHKSLASTADQNKAARQSLSNFTGMVGDGLSKAFHTTDGQHSGRNRQCCRQCIR